MNKKTLELVKPKWKRHFRTVPKITLCLVIRNECIEYNGNMATRVYSYQIQN